MQTIPHYKPDELAYRTIINVLVNARRMNVAEAVFEEFVKSGMGPSHDDYVIFMAGYTKCGSLQRGVNVLQKMRDAGIRPLVSAYNVLLDGCNRSIRGYFLYLFSSAIPGLCERDLSNINLGQIPTVIFYYIYICVVMKTRPGDGSSA